MKTPTPKTIKSLVLLAAAVALGCGQGLRAQTPLPIYEPFPAAYTNGGSDETVQVPAPPASGVNYPSRRLGNAATATLWSIGNSAGGGSMVVVGGSGLSYPGLYQDTTPNVGVFIRTNNTTANRNRGILFPDVSSGAVYVSFLLNVQTNPAPEATQAPYNRLLAKLDSYNITYLTNNSGSGLMGGVWLTTNNSLAISKSSNNDYAADTVSSLASGTHLVVMRYQFNGGTDDDEVALWVDPAQASFNAPEPNVPAPALTLTTGTDVPSLASFLLYHVGSEVVIGAFFDEVRLATTWAGVTSTNAPCVAASVSTQPVDRTVNEGIAASFAVIAGGTSPTYQWQVSTNGGSTWYNVSDGIGGTNATYRTLPLIPPNNGNKYRAVVNVTCGGSSSATSSVATVTVVNAAPTTNGVVVDDVFQDGLYNNLPYGISNSVWFAGVASSLDASSGISMIATPQTGSANWVGYFTDDSVTNLPVHLEVGKAMKGSLVFKGTGITASNGGLRMGLFDYADGATRLTADGYGNAMNGVNVRGYMVAINYGTSFSSSPVTLHVRQNLAAGDLMGTTADYVQLGAGPANLSGQPAFQDGVNYTVEMTVNRTAATSCDITCSITGGGSNWTHTVTDNTYAYPRFDTFAIRAANAATTATQFEISRLLVEVVSAAPAPIPLNITLSGGDVTLTWSNPSFNLQASSVVTGSYTNVTGATSPYVISAGEAQKFFRLTYP